MSVVVRVQGPDRSRAALRAAAQEARFRGTQLVAVTAYSGDHGLAAPAPGQAPPGESGAALLFRRPALGSGTGNALARAQWPGR